MRGLNITLAALMLLMQSQAASAYDMQKTVDDTAQQIRELVDAKKAELYAEWIADMAIVNAIESAQKINELVGLPTDNTVVAVSAVIGGMVGVPVAVRLADGTIRFITPDGSRAAAFKQSMIELRAERTVARKALNAAKAAKNPEMIAEAELVLTSVQGKITRQLTLKPSLAYKGARLVRGLARTSVVLAGMTALTVGMTDVVVISFPRPVDQVKTELLANIERIEAILDAGDADQSIGRPAGN